MPRNNDVNITISINGDTHNLRAAREDVKIKNIREIENERKKAELKNRTDELEKQLSENPASVFQIDTIGAKKELERRKKKENTLKLETKNGPKNVEVITHQEIVDHLQKRVVQAQVRYNKNPNDINTRRLNDAKKDLFNTKRDGEVLIKGSIPPEYFTFE